MNRKINNKPLSVLLAVFMMLTLTVPCFATSTTGSGVNMWLKTSEIMKDIYTQIVTISSIDEVV